jgi:hypothetical protein
MKVLPMPCSFLFPLYLSLTPAGNPPGLTKEKDEEERRKIQQT